MSSNNAELSSIDVTPTNVNQANVSMRDIKNTALDSSSPISKILSHPTQLYVGNININSQVNTIIYQTDVSPTRVASTSTTRLSVIAALFRQWKGAINFLFQFTKTVYVDMKIIMAFIPQASVSDANILQVHDLVAQEYHEILNVTNTHEVTFSVPFISTRNWLDINESSGVFTVRVYSPIVASLTNVQFVPFSVLISTCHDAGKLDHFSLRYLSSTTSVTVTPNTTLDLAYGIDDPDTIQSSYVPSSTNPFEPVRTLFYAPPSTWQSNLNSNSPLYQWPDQPIYDYGGASVVPTAYSNAAHTPTMTSADQHPLTPIFNRLVNNIRMRSKFSTISNASHNFTRLMLDPPYDTNVYVGTGFHDIAKWFAGIGTTSTTKYMSQQWLAIKFVIPATIKYYAVNECLLTLNIRFASDLMLTCTTYGHAENSTAPIIRIEPINPGLSAVFILANHTYFALRSGNAYTSYFGQIPFAPTGPLPDNCLLDFNVTFQPQRTQQLDNFTLSPLRTKLMAEVANIPQGFNSILSFSTTDIPGTKSMVADWLDSTSYSHSECLSIGTSYSNTLRSGRRDVTDTVASTAIHSVFDVILDGTIIGDAISLVGNILMYFAPFVAKGRLGSPNGYIDIQSTNHTVLMRYNADKSNAANSYTVGSNDFKEALTSIRSKQHDDSSSYKLLMIQQVTAPIGHLLYNTNRDNLAEGR